MCCGKSWTMIGAVFAALAVIFGAFAAHGLEGYLVRIHGDAVKTVAGMQVPAAWKYLQDFRTGAEYQMYHALGLIAVGLISAGRSSRALQIAGWSFLLGIFLFSGSLYGLVITGQTRLGMIAPLGGTLFIVGWSALAIATCSCAGSAGPPSPIDIPVPLPTSENRKETDPSVRV